MLSGFATEGVVAQLPHLNLIMFSERDAEALNAADNAEIGNVGQDDCGTWRQARSDQFPDRRVRSPLP